MAEVVLDRIRKTFGASHHAIKDLSDCDRVSGEKRVECGACTMQNKAQGWIGEYEYRPDNKDGERCVRVK